MSSILDDTLVGLALVLSAGYAVSSLGPRSWRRRLFGAVSRLTSRTPAFLGLRRTARWFAGASEAKADGACGGCDSCGSEQQVQEPPGAEVSVPGTQNGRRQHPE